MTSRYTYTRDSLIGRNGEISPINCIHAASKVLKGRGLTNQSINKARDALKGLSESTGMKGMEPLAFVPVFDRDLTETSTGLTDLADYFNCPVLDVMGYYCFLADLEQDGFLTSENSMCVSPLKRRYRVNANVMEAIIQGKKVKENRRPEKQKKMDQLDFCRFVSAMADSREKGEIDTQELLGNIMQLEDALSEFVLVKAMKDKGISIENRTIMYVICDDYAPGMDRNTELSDVLDDVFDAPGDRLSYRSSVFQLENQLMKEGWIE